MLREQIRVLEDAFLAKYWRFVPEAVSRVALDICVPVRDLCALVRNSAYPVVSMDRIYVPTAAQFLEVTRVTNPDTGTVCLGPRSGCAALEEQVQSISGDNIVLADVGAFDGNTIAQVVEVLECAGKTVQNVLLAFSSTTAAQKIRQQKPLTALYTFDFYEWIELRDLFGIDGRNVGLQNGQRQFIPYCENLTQWASIPKDAEKQAATLCRQYNAKLMQLLTQNNYDIRKIGLLVPYQGGVL